MTHTRPHGYIRDAYIEDTDAEIVPPPGHPWERPLFLLCVLVSLLLAAVLLRLLWTVSGTSPWIPIFVVSVPLGCWWARGLRYARERAESVRISPTQFPEAYRLVMTLSAETGLARAPEAYVRIGTPSASLDAAAHGLRRYLILPGAMFDGEGRLRDPDALAFLVAHQIGHIAAGHTGYWQRLATLGAELVPGLGAALARVREYTADDHALAQAPEGAHAVRLFAGGAELYTRVNLGEMAARATGERGVSLSLYHLLSRRPSNVRRMAALRDRGRRGRVFL